jgi:hypothetical protein
LKPLKECLGLTLAELKKIVFRHPVVLGYNHDSLVNEKLEPLQRRVKVTDAELSKIIVGLSAVLGLNHDSLVEKLKQLQQCLDLATAAGSAGETDCAAWTCAWTITKSIGVVQSAGDISASAMEGRTGQSRTETRLRRSWSD